MARFVHAMFNQMRQVWKQFKASPPGRRFQDMYQRRHAKGHAGGAWRWLWVGAGVVLLAAGVVFLAIPGPGTLVIVFGLALIARESLWMARMLDRLEVVLRPPALRLQRWWRGLPSRQRVGLKATSAVLGAVAAAGAVYFFYLR